MIKNPLETIRRWPSGLRDELGAHLSAWYLAYQAVSLAYTQVKVYEPPASHYVWTAVFPLAWFWAYRLPLTFRSESRRWTKTATAILLPILLLAYSITWARPYPLEGRDLLLYTELWSLCVFAAVVMHCTVRGTRRLFIHIFVIGFAYGLVLENSGIVTGFFSEEGYRFYLPGIPAPVYTMAGWCTAVYVSVHVAEGIWRIRAERVTQVLMKALVATAVALSIDMQVDPAATYGGWWVWHTDLGPEIMGVPVLNFVAWFAALFPFFCAYFWYTREPVRAAQVMLRPMVGSLAIALAAAAVLILLFAATFFGLDSTAWHLLADAIAHPIETMWGQ
jgi:hypothetical protein